MENEEGKDKGYRQQSTSTLHQDDKIDKIDLHSTKEEEEEEQSRRQLLLLLVKCAAA